MIGIDRQPSLLVSMIMIMALECERKKQTKKREKERSGWIGTVDCRLESQPTRAKQPPPPLPPSFQNQANHR